MDAEALGAPEEE